MNQLTIPAIFCMLAVMAFGTSAEGQEEIQLFDQSGNPVQLNNMQTQVLQLQEGQIYTGQVNEPTAVSGNVQDLFTGTDNAGVTHFTFKVAPYQTELVVGQGTGANTFLVESQQSQLPFGITTTDLGLLGVVVAVIAMLVWLVRRKLENS